MRALGKGELEQARASLKIAVRELGVTLDLDHEHAAALLNRAVCHAQLARILSELDQPLDTADALGAALVDYDLAVAADSSLGVAWFDRALLHLRRSRLAQLSRQGRMARLERERAASDLREALGRVSADHPWRWRFEELAEDLR